MVDDEEEEEDDDDGWVNTPCNGNCINWLWLAGADDDDCTNIVLESDGSCVWVVDGMNEPTEDNDDDDVDDEDAKARASSAILDACSTDTNACCCEPTDETTSDEGDDDIENKTIATALASNEMNMNNDRKCPQQISSWKTNLLWTRKIWI